MIVSIYVKNSSIEDFISLQKNLNKNGYYWNESNDDIKTYIGGDYIVLYNKQIYYMNENNVKYMQNNNKLIVYDHITDYLRNQKLKRIKKIINN